MDHFTSHADKLIEIGILDREDLETNRSGHLSERQKRRLSVGLYLWLGLATLDVILVILALYFQFFTQANVAIIVFGVPLLSWLTLMCLREAKPYWEDIKNDRPRSVAGQMNKHFSTTRGNMKGARIAYCSIRVGGEVFSVSPMVYDRVFDGTFYRVYFVSQTRKVVCIEPL